MAEMSTSKKELKQLQPLQACQEKASLEELFAIAKQVSDQVKRPYLDHAALLYDENGLPV